MKQIERPIEAMIFAAETGITFQEIFDVLQTMEHEEPGGPDLLDEKLVSSAISSIKARYASPDSALELRTINQTYQFLTKQEYHPAVNLMQSHRARKKLSQAALETLAIIAYRQPITKLEIEHIRGVNCDYTVQKLLEKELICITGKSESPGRPILYGTSDMLMDYFGLQDISELPKLKEITNPENSIGTQQESS